MPTSDTSKPLLQQIGTYDIVCKIAEGGMGTVYKGRHRESGDIVAIKVLPSNTAHNPVLLKRFEQEFSAARMLDHPNVVKAFEFCGTGPMPFLVMEFVEGESLGKRIERDGPISEEVAIRLIAQVCQGLHRAHKNKLIHRDVKPDNIMVTPEGNAKLMDLGLVKDGDNELNLTKTGRGLGTPHFMAPEQFRNAKHADVRCDIYSVGATLYMMLTGQVPFGKVGPLDCWMKKIRNDFVAPQTVNPKISERIDWAIRRAMSGDPDQRPNSCREFVEDLTGVTIRSQSVLSEPKSEDVADLWYLVYKDDEGVNHTVKGTTEGIRRALKDGLLGNADNIRACRSKAGPFQSIRTCPEFRDLVVEPAPMPPSSPASSGAYPVPPSTKSSPAVARPRVSSTSTQKASTNASDGNIDLNAPRLNQNGSREAPAAPIPSTRTRPHIEFKGVKGDKANWKLWGTLALIGVAIAVVAAIVLVKLL